MIEFSKCMRSTGVEHRVRMDVIGRMKDVISELWPYARVELFGSFTVGLHLPQRFSFSILNFATFQCYLLTFYYCKVILTL